MKLLRKLPFRSNSNDSLKLGILGRSKPILPHTVTPRLPIFSYSSWEAICFQGTTERGGRGWKQGKLTHHRVVWCFLKVLLFFEVCCFLKVLLFFLIFFLNLQLFNCRMLNKFIFTIFTSVLMTFMEEQNFGDTL